MQPIFKQPFKKTRFAPSPTGFLHRGHVLSAIWVWGMSRICGSKVLLRIEDHDLSRSREVHVDAILRDLQWLGFHWDEYARQSNHFQRYSNGLRKLEESGCHIYACDCNRKMLSSAPVYSGRCRHRILSRDPSAETALRLELPAQVITWEDLCGRSFSETPTDQCGDLMLQDRLGQWTYQYAVTLDDLEEEIDLVVRGEDLLDSTARQIQLSEMLGRSTPPRYLHHPLILDQNGNKLSKRQLSKSIASERESGISPDRLLGEVCLAGKLISDYREVKMEEIPYLIESAEKFT